MTKRERWAQKEARSLGIGETSQSDENCSSRKDWSKVFLLLYEMLREYGTHLVEAAWTHQVMLLFESTPRSDYSNHMSYTVFHAQMESFEGFFHWMVVLWERGFTHDNPQVRYLVMHSFLDITWEHYLVCPQIVPRGFVLGPLLRGLNDVVHHKDFGQLHSYYTKFNIKSTYSSLSNTKFFFFVLSPNMCLFFVCFLVPISFLWDILEPLAMGNIIFFYLKNPCLEHSPPKLPFLCEV